jgi:hypothetical protein
MAEKNAKPGANLLDKLDAAEAASVFRKLLDRHSELRAEVEDIARGMLAGISPLSVAGEIEDALLQFDYDDLNGRAGSRSWGYVEPSEAAGELLEEALEPFVNWAPDFPGEAAGDALEVWSETGGSEHGGAPAKKRRRRLAPDFVREHVPDWDWLLKPHP